MAYNEHKFNINYFGGIFMTKIRIPESVKTIGQATIAGAGAGLLTYGVITLFEKSCEAIAKQVEKSKAKKEAKKLVEEYDKKVEVEKTEET